MKIINTNNEGFIDFIDKMICWKFLLTTAKLYKEVMIGSSAQKILSPSLTSKLYIGETRTR